LLEFDWFHGKLFLRNMMADFYAYDQPAKVRFGGNPHDKLPLDAHAVSSVYRFGFRQSFVLLRSLF
jgi:hypothetical protein